MKIDIISGFLGAGKTTFINKIIPALIGKEKIALVENEFGEIGIDGSLFLEHGITIKEISSGCICCTLFGSFVVALNKLIDEYMPDRIIIEPTGVGMLSDVVKACYNAIDRSHHDAFINIKASAVDVSNFGMYEKMFGDFFHDQISAADCLVLSRIQQNDDLKIRNVISLLRILNPSAKIIATNWFDTGADELLSLLTPISPFQHVVLERGHIHEGQTHHDDDDESIEGFEVFSTKSERLFPEKEFSDLLNMISSDRSYGLIVRSKGVFETTDQELQQYDFVPGDFKCFPPKIKKAGFVIIGKDINKEKLRALFV